MLPSARARLFTLWVPVVLLMLGGVPQLAGCSSEAGKPAPTERAASPSGSAAANIPAAQNINKLIIGGNNRDPQMGLFALPAAEAKAVLAAMQQDAKQAYDLALAKATKSWAGARNYCADAVRMTIHYLGTDGMMSPDDWAKWRTASFAALKTEHLRAINELHQEMMGEANPAGCEDSLRTYVEALTFAATNQLELLNFGF